MNDNSTIPVALKSLPDFCRLFHSSDKLFLSLKVSSVLQNQWISSVSEILDTWHSHTTSQCKFVVLQYFICQKEKALNPLDFSKWKAICQCRLLQFTCASHCWKSLWITLETGFQLLLLPTYILPHSAEIRKVIIHVLFVRCCCYCIFNSGFTST